MEGKENIDQRAGTDHNRLSDLPAVPPAAITELNTGKMEVHHHPDLHHKKKKFKEYFLEFLMIFLAVTLGFFAESLRENIGDSNEEKEYMQSLLHNLKEDATSLENTITENLGKSRRLDSVIALAPRGLAADGIRQKLYEYVPGTVSYFSVFKSNDATMMQLKNSGGLRFIKKEHIADSIAAYDNEVKIIYEAENLYNAATNAANLATHEIINYSVYYDSVYFKAQQFTGKRLPLLTDDPKSISLFFNKIIYEKGATDNYTRNLQSRVPVLKSLIKYIEKNYGVDQ